MQDSLSNYIYHYTAYNIFMFDFDTLSNESVISFISKFLWARL
jgi:hypothetical protein